ncbi:MAG TPA: TetR/AcrR family transcriptional regulator [Clostridia bacterium]|nr:TetR/AcrR family transcriptional regulator [Clostridia bacterium]
MANDKQKTQVRQEQIATAALQIIGRHGTRALNIARIARAVGLVPSAIYRHFGGKDEVIDAVLNLVRSNLQANVLAAAKDAESPLDALRSLVNSHIRFLCENDGVSTLIFSDQVYSGPKKRKAKIYEVIKGYLQGISKLVRDGQQKHFIRSDIDADVVAVMFLGLVQPPGILWHLSEGNFGVRNQTDQAWQVFEKAIRQH